ncbi:MAG: DUF342 domain-containing protein, partial [Leptospiraceae bacterium]|nr:DUF342 domain-containing protein [Leptospiraceae bacterium]
MSINSYTESILNELENFEDGYFQVRNSEGFAVLSVYKPGKSGKKVDVKDVFSRLKVFGIKDFEVDEIEKIVKNADGKEHKIAKWTGGQPVDSTLQIEISEDLMEAYVTIFPPKQGGALLTKEDIFVTLRSNEIVFGIDEPAIDSLINNQKFHIKTLVAKGKEAIPAINGYIKILFDSGNKPKLKTDDHGKVNFKNLNVIKSISKGTVLAEKVDPQAGQIGQNIKGMDIPFEVAQPGQWLVGANCELSEDGKKLISKIDGRPLIDRDGSIRVDEVILLENVDYSTGNVDFPGTIVVEGTVADNFTLRTKGSLFIKKSVGRVFLYAEKDIVLSGGVMGRNGGFIESGGDIYTKFVEQGNLKAGGSIFIEEASLHSALVAGDGINIHGGRGELIGGESIAGNYINVSKLGAVVETKTSLIVGLPPNILDELKRMKEEISHKEELLKKIRQSLQKLNDKIAAHKDLNSDEKET